MKYKTKHQAELMKYIENIPGVHFTVKDIVEHFQKDGKNVGTTTVYRQLDKLVDEGIVKKYVFDGNSPACFEYVPKELQCDDEAHNVQFHCKCEKCGVIIHLHCEDLSFIATHLLEHHSFMLNPMRTVFYGLCENCR
ncbi:MAG: transcriptional repressor [Lachnospiraceae bacterium]|jgi:Fur family ferric uptake transcriptional regulator|nr:transcriptional repressor [Lachnospiraceae bacterium]